MKELTLLSEALHSQSYFISGGTNKVLSQESAAGADDGKRKRVFRVCGIRILACSPFPGSPLLFLDLLQQLFPLRLKRSIDDGIDFRHEIRRIASNFFQTLPGNAPLSFFLSPINALEHTSAILAIAFGFRNTLVRPHFPCIFLIFYTFARTFVSSALTKLGMGAHFQPSRVQNKY